MYLHIVCKNISEEGACCCQDDLMCCNLLVILACKGIIINIADLPLFIKYPIQIT